VLKEYRKEHKLTQERLAYDLNRTTFRRSGKKDQRRKIGNKRSNSQGQHCRNLREANKMEREQNKEHSQEQSLIQIEGPNYIEAQWTVVINIGPKHQTLYAQTEQEAYEQIEQHLDQQIAEIEASRKQLRALLNQPKKHPWP
jgi:hypothetical protein